MKDNHATNIKKVLVVDDHPLIQAGMKNVLSELGFKSIGAGTAGEALTLLGAENFDLILLDIGLPDIDGKSLVKIIRLNKVTTPVLVISAKDNTQDILWMLNNGIQGFIKKNEPISETRQAIISVIQGGTYIPPQIKAANYKDEASKNSVRDFFGISERKKQILLLLEQGKSNKQIADEIHISENTVSGHLKELFTNLKVHNRTECVKTARDLGII